LVRDRGEHAELRRTERRACGENDGSLPDVFSAPADVLLRVAWIVDPSGAVGRLLGVFLTDDGVGALRQRRAGEDPDRLRRSDGRAGQLAGRHALDGAGLRGAALAQVLTARAL